MRPRLLADERRRRSSRDGDSLLVGDLLGFLLTSTALSINCAAAERACRNGAVSLSDVAKAAAPSNNTISWWPSAYESAAPASSATAANRSAKRRC